MRTIRTLLILFLFVQLAYTQDRTICLTVCDIETRAPISDVYVFIANSTYGSTSNQSGICQFSMPAFVRQDLIVSHVSYSLRIMPFISYDNYNNCDTLFLQLQNIDISEVNIKSKRSKKWYKQLKKFTKSFIGTSKAASKCKILNPEVLQFYESDNSFLAKARDMLLIKNEYLGYEIQFLLTDFKIEEDGSSRYQGNARYRDLTGDVHNEEIIKNREKAFLQSPKHFFQSIIYDNLDEDNYDIILEKLEHNAFTLIADPSSKDLIEFQAKTNTYYLRFVEFLTIIDKKYKVRLSSLYSPSLSNRESARFNNPTQNETIRLEYARSHIYKTANYVEIDPYGNVLNPGHIREYGLWASQRLADQLPIYYGNEKVQHKLIAYNKAESQIKESPVNTMSHLGASHDSILNGFVLNNLKVNIEDIKYGGVPKDGIQAIYNPRFEKTEAVRFLGDDDLLIMTEEANTCKAYPLAILNRHELVNDGKLLVSYCPLCHSALVFDLDASGLDSPFGVSGLLYQSDVLMYDHRTQSLWSQIKAIAISGTMAGHRLEILESHLVDFNTLHTYYPQCDVLLAPDLAHESYHSDPYQSYKTSDRLMFPVKYTSGLLPSKTIVIGVPLREQSVAIPLERIIESTGAYTFEHDNTKYEITYNKGKISVTDTNSKNFSYQQMYWFAWYTFHPDTKLLSN